MGAGTDALRAAIDEAWRVFDIPAPATTGVCEHCCMDPKIEADFLKQTARDLPADYVRDWYFAAFADGIGHDHVAWFLPRVMEMLADGEDVAVVGHQVVFARLPLTGFPERWTKEEVNAVQRFALAFFDTVLASDAPKSLPGIDSWLCMFGQGGIDIGPLLARLDALDDARLINLLHRDWVHPNGSFIPVDAFWDQSPARTAVWTWYTSSVLAARMEGAAMAGNEKALDLYDIIVAHAGASSAD